MAIRSIDPTSGETLESFEPFTEAQVDACLHRAELAFRRHRQTPVSQRRAWMLAAATLFEEEKQRLATTAVEEMGKTLKAAVAEVEKCALCCRHYAEHAERYLADQPYPAPGGRSFVRPLPLGPVLAVMPWNFPFWQVVRFAAPALMAGNVGLLKHAANVTRCSLALESVFRRAGFPEGTFQSLLLPSNRVAAVLADPRVKAVTLTGSEEAGASVAEAAGRHLKKVVLELGGSDPFVVMPSADLDAAVRTAVTARTLNNGQSCIAAKRFIVHREVYSAFEARFVEALSRLRLGDPRSETTDLGPLATAEVRRALDAQVRASVTKGARLLLGGQVPSGPGYFYPATALAEIPRDAPAAREELFGPVALLFQVKDLEEALAVANGSDFGLGSSVWTRDEAEQARFIDELEAGQTFVNAMVASDPRLPFGGVKRSGFGRELADLGLREFMNLKTVMLAGEDPPASASE